VNSSSGMTYISDCTILENGADGIKYVHSNERPDDKLDRTDVFDLCTFPTTASQTFPVTISMEQSKYAPNIKRCPQVNIIYSLLAKECRDYKEILLISNYDHTAHFYEAGSRFDAALFANENR